MSLLGRFFRNRFVSRILEADAPPERIARGAAVGSFVAVTPTIGFQILLTIMLATLVRGNRLAAVAMTFVLNPIIFVPPSYWYFPSYYLGTFLLGSDAVGFSRIAEAYESSTGLFTLLGNLWSLGIDVYGPMLLGSAVIGAPIALLMYCISLRIVVRHRAGQGEPGSSATGDMNGGKIVSQDTDNGADADDMPRSGVGTGDERKGS